MAPIRRRPQFLSMRWALKEYSLLDSRSPESVLIPADTSRDKEFAQTGREMGGGKEGEIRVWRRETDSCRS